MAKPDYDTTIARMAGDIAAGLLADPNADYSDEYVARCAVRIARAIVVEVVCTEPDLPKPLPKGANS